ncbi:hypothetical protein [Micromonospora sp. NPDC007230]|uniref:hypothetical protein n=1 Tax=Micromonospora sp. NPDC007230 TaxID=3364237 RepID=UPI0036A47327
MNTETVVYLGLVFVLLAVIIRGLVLAVRSGRRSGAHARFALYACLAFLSAWSALAMWPVWHFVERVITGSTMAVEHPEVRFVAVSLFLLLNAVGCFLMTSAALENRTTTAR